MADDDELDSFFFGFLDEDWNVLVVGDNGDGDGGWSSSSHSL